MKELIRTLYLAIGLMTCFVFSYGQEKDSLKVYFIGHDPVGEKFEVQYGNSIKLKFKSNGGYKHSFYIPLRKGKKYGDPMNIHILRKGPFSLFYRDTQFNPHFQEGFRYLVIIRDNTIKNRFAVRYEWRNEEPYVHHLVNDGS